MVRTGLIAIIALCSGWDHLFGSLSRSSALRDFSGGPEQFW
jgi:hypothetical protein